MRGWRKAAENYMADVWLAQAAIEVRRREWDDERRRFNNRIADNQVAKLFRADASDDEQSIDRIDLALARDALAQSSARLDTRTMVVTALAGIAGVLGAVLGGHGRDACLLMRKARLSARLTLNSTAEAARRI